MWNFDAIDARCSTGRSFEGASDYLSLVCLSAFGCPTLKHEMLGVSIALIGRLGSYSRCLSLPSLFSCSLIVRRDICTLIIPAAPSVNKLPQLVSLGAASILIYWGAGPLLWLTGIRPLITGFSSLSLVSVVFLTSDFAANIV